MEGPQRARERSNKIHEDHMLVLLVFFFFLGFLAWSWEEIIQWLGLGIILIASNEGLPIRRGGEKRKEERDSSSQ